jgi:hypothetical protein
MLVANRIAPRCVTNPGDVSMPGKQQDTNGQITEATSVPGPVLACMGEVIAKGALYYGAVSPKRTLVSSER